MKRVSGRLYLHLHVGIYYAPYSIPRNRTIAYRLLP